MITALMHALSARRPGDREEGASALEYVLLAGLIAVIIVSAVTLLGGDIRAILGDVANRIGDGSAAS